MTMTLPTGILFQLVIPERALIVAALESKSMPSFAQTPATVSPASSLWLIS
jgi:hypothetical protein